MDIIEDVKEGLDQANKPADRVSFDDFEEILSEKDVEFSMMNEETDNGGVQVNVQRVYRLMTDGGAYRLELLAHASDAYGVGMIPTDFSEYESDTYNGEDIVEIFGEGYLPLPL